MLLNQAEEKDHFQEQLIVLVTSVAPSEALVIAADFNVHAGLHRQGFSQHHGGCGYGTQIQEGMRILDLCAATDLTVRNTFFRERETHNQLQLKVITLYGCYTKLCRRCMEQPERLSSEWGG